MHKAIEKGARVPAERHQKRAQKKTQGEKKTSLPKTVIKNSLDEQKSAKNWCLLR